MDEGKHVTRDPCYTRKPQQTATLKLFFIKIWWYDFVQVRTHKASWNKYLVSPFPPDPYKRGRPKVLEKICILFFTGFT